MRSLTVLLSIPFLSAVASAALLDPFVEVRFAKSGTLPGPNNLGMYQDPTSVQRAVLSATAPAYVLGARSSFDNFGAYSEQDGAVAPGQARGMNAFAIMVDKLFISSASTDATYRWKAKVRVDGTSSWTSTGNVTANLWPVGFAMAQYTMRETETSFKRYSLPDVNLPQGTYDQEIDLPEVVVPANEWFNYSFLFAVNTRIYNLSGVSVSAAKGDFLNTVVFTQLQLTDSLGNPIDFKIESASGARYSASGIQVVPEPASFALAIAGLLAVSVLRRRS